jgi:hypothetical protein
MHCSSSLQERPSLRVCSSSLQDKTKAKSRLFEIEGMPMSSILKQTKHMHSKLTPCPYNIGIPSILKKDNKSICLSRIVQDILSGISSAARPPCRLAHLVKIIVLLFSSRVAGRQELERKAAQRIEDDIRES